MTDRDVFVEKPPAIGERRIDYMDKKMTQDDRDECCKGQCGYDPYCSECIKEKKRKWKESLREKVSTHKCTDDNAR